MAVCNWHESGAPDATVVQRGTIQVSLRQSMVVVFADDRVVCILRQYTYALKGEERPYGRYSFPARMQRLVLLLVDHCVAGDSHMQQVSLGT